MLTCTFVALYNNRRRWKELNSLKLSPNASNPHYRKDSLQMISTSYLSAAISRTELIDSYNKPRPRRELLLFNNDRISILLSKNRTSSYLNQETHYFPHFAPNETFHLITSPPSVLKSFSSTPHCTTPPPLFKSFKKQF